MSIMRPLGFGLACLVTGSAMVGAVLLVALDFAGTDGLARAWSGLSRARAAEPAPPPPAAAATSGQSAASDALATRLQGVGQIDLFVVADVPGSPVKVTTGTAYANARDLAQGTPSSRWCYAGRDGATSPFQPTVTLGKQNGTSAPVLLQAASLSAEDARHLGLAPDVLADLARRLCRFGG